MIAKRVIYEGRVQGVGFRFTVREIATGFDICGSVRNLPDGSVELQAMGEPDEVDAFLEHIAEESPLAHHIRKMRIDDIPPLENARGFRIAH